MIWTLQGSSVVGCMGATSSNAPFGRDSVVLAHDEHPDARLILGRHQDGGTVTGESMAPASWRELLACEEAIEFARPVALASATTRPRGWLLRGNFPDRERTAGELRSCQGAVLYEETRDDVLLFLVDESRARDLLERWSRAAFDGAWRSGQQGDWQQAHDRAELAWLTDISLDLDRVALLALAVEFIEGASAAQDLIAFELDSRRPRPEEDLRRRIADYRRQFAEPRPGKRRSTAPGGA